MATPWKTQNNFYRKYLYSVMQLYQSRPDVRMFTEVILSLIAVAIFGAFAIRPTVVTIASLVQEIDSKEKIVAQLDIKVQNLTKAQENYQQNSGRISLLDTSVPSKPAPQLYIRQLEALVANNSLSLSSINIEDVVIKGESLGTATFQENLAPTTSFPEGATEIKFSFTVSGSYDNLASFLRDIGNLRMIILEDRGSLSSSDIDNNLTLTISGRMPYIKE